MDKEYTPIKWFIDKWGLGRSADGQTKQFPGYTPEKITRAMKGYIETSRFPDDPSYWQRGSFQGDSYLVDV